MAHSGLETLFSLARDVPASDPLPSGSTVATFDRAMLAQGSARQMCALLKIAEGGAVIHADMPLIVGDRVMLELNSGHRIAGATSWVEGSRAGVRFDRAVDVLAIVARNLVNQPGERRRLPRIELECRAVVETNGVSERARLKDISQGGLCIESPLSLAPGDRVRIEVDGLRALDGKVAWADKRVAGLEIVPELNWQELMPWLRERRERMPAPSAPVSAEGPVPGQEGNIIQLNLPARVREGTRRWDIEVRSVELHQIAFECHAPLRLGSLLWVVLPGLEGWSARVTGLEGHLYAARFTHPLHHSMIDRIRQCGRNGTPVSAHG